MNVSGVSTTTTTKPAVKVSTRPEGQFAKVDFMQMLVTQLRYQDPMKPMDDQNFAAQLAQFSALEQAAEQNRWAQMTYGLGLVGQQVTFRGEDGASLTSVVKALRVVDGKPILSLGETEISIDQVLEARKP